MLFGNMATGQSVSRHQANLNACQFSALAGVNACLGIANRVLVSSKGLLGNQGPFHKSPEGWGLARLILFSLLVLTLEWKAPPCTFLQ